MENGKTYDCVRIKRTFFDGRVNSRQGDESLQRKDIGGNTAYRLCFEVNLILARSVWVFVYCMGDVRAIKWDGEQGSGLIRTFRKREIWDAQSELEICNEPSN